MIDLDRLKFLIDQAIPAWDRMNEDRKRVDAFFEDWQEAMSAEQDPLKRATLAGIPLALCMKLPTGFTVTGDPFKGFRLLADDFARACNFERYKKRRKL